MPPPTAGHPRGKPATRRMLLARRDSLSERERLDGSRAICERTAELIGKRCAVGSMVALYAHKGTEVETVVLDEALRAGGFRIAYPRVVDESRVLVFSEAAIDALEPSRWGLREPRADADAVVLEEIAAFVLPGLAFDRAGGRVGWGKGHYDATLAAVGDRAVTIGLAFDCQLVDSVPREAHDELLDAIITEVATHVVA